MIARIVIAACAALFVVAMPIHIAAAQQQPAPAVKKKAAAPPKGQSPAAARQYCEAELAKDLADADEEDVWDNDAERAEFIRDYVANCVRARTGRAAKG